MSTASSRARARSSTYAAALAGTAERRREAQAARTDANAATIESVPQSLLNGLLMERMGDAVFATDLANRVTFWAGSAERLFGYAACDALGKQFGELLPFRMAADQHEPDLLGTIAAGRTWRGEGSVRLPDGAELWIESTVSPIIIEGRVVGSVSVSRDMTRQRDEAQARAAAERALRVLSAVNRALVHTSDEPTLLGEVCRVVVEQGGYRLAWVGYAQDDASQSVRPMASAGSDGGYVAAARVSWADDVRGRGPMGIAIRSGRPAVVRNARTDASFAPWLDAASQHGFASVAVLPLLTDGRAFGALAVYAGEPDAFGTREVELLTEMTADLAYGIEACRSQVEHAREASVRSALADAVRSIPADASLEQAGQALCDELAGLLDIDFVGVATLAEGDGVVCLAVHPTPNFAPAGDPGSTSDDARLARAQEALAASVRLWHDKRDIMGTVPASSVPGMAGVAFAPIGHGGAVAGLLVIRGQGIGLAPTLHGRMPGLLTVSTTASALLGERLVVRQRAIARRRELDATIARRAFQPVFQPIVALASREIVAYEALTRFDSAERPDLCFAGAWAVGLGPSLERVTLEAALAAAAWLPARRWLDLNVSPRLLVEATWLREIAWPSKRAVVLEVTEHEHVADYGALREVVRHLGHGIRLAVDDAGAGIANFGHIVELRPDFVKLDISLVRGVHANLGRQALITAMCQFARSAGCRLVAEGIETEDEAATLTGLGVEFGQGYLFGRPAPIEAIGTDTSAIGSEPQLPLQAGRSTSPGQRAASGQARCSSRHVPQ